MSGFQVPNTRRPLVDPDKLAAFAAGADLPETKQLDDKRRSHVFNLRLTEREMAALHAATETTPESKHAFCIRILRENLSGMV